MTNLKFSIIIIFLGFNSHAAVFEDNFNYEQGKVSTFEFSGTESYKAGKYLSLSQCINGLSSQLLEQSEILAKEMLAEKIDKNTTSPIMLLKTTTEYGQTCAYVYSRLKSDESDDIDIDEISHELLLTTNAFNTSSTGKSNNIFRNISRGTPRSNALKDAMISAVQNAIISLKPEDIITSNDAMAFKELAAKIFLKGKKGLINKYRISSEYTHKNHFYIELDVTINISKLNKLIKSIKRRSQSPIFYVDIGVADDHPYILQALSELKIETTDILDEAQIIVSAINNDDGLQTFEISELDQSPLYSWTPSSVEDISTKKFKRLFTTSLMLISSKGGTIYNILIDRYTSPGIEILTSNIKKIRGVNFQSIESYPYADEIIIRSNLQLHKVASRIMQFLSNHADSLEMLLLKNKLMQFKRPTRKIITTPNEATIIIHKGLKIDTSKLMSDMDGLSHITSISSSVIEGDIFINTSYYGDSKEFSVDASRFVAMQVNDELIPYSNAPFALHFTIDNEVIQGNSLIQYIKKSTDSAVYYLSKITMSAYNWLVSMVNEVASFFSTQYAKYF
jgi:hypothetical protein